MQELTVKLNKHSGSEQITVSVPTSWNELKPFQMLYIAKYYRDWQKSAMAGSELVASRAKLFLELCDLSSRSDKKRLCNYLALVDEDTDFNILSLTDFIFSKLDLTKNLLPTIKVGFLTEFCGPDEALQNTVIEEFSFAFHCYNQYNTKGVEADLNNLCAVLYRPKRSSSEIAKVGEKRVEFNHRTIEARALKFSGVGMEYKQAVYLYFRGSMEYLSKAFPMVFKRAEGEQKKSGGSFIDAILAMSGSKFGDFNSTKATDTYLVLKHLSDLLIEAENRAKK